MKLHLSDDQIEMVLTALRGTRQVWEDQAKNSQLSEVRRLATEQGISWTLLIDEVEEQYNGDSNEG